MQLLFTILLHRKMIIALKYDQLDNTATVFDALETVDFDDT